MAKQSKSIIIGIDGGGSRTRGVLYQGDKELAYAETGTARVGSVGSVESSERLLNLIRDLCKSAKISGDAIESIVIGLAGVWLRGEQMRSEQLLKLFARERKIEFDNLLVTSDAAIALEGAFQGDVGIVLIVGTGTIAIGKTAAGELVRCGGWGIELSDEGSGAWLGREGLTAVARSFDGRGKQTALADMIVKLFPVIKPEEPRTLVSAYNERMFEYPTIAPMVMECAEQGDEVCLDIIDRATSALMEMLDALANRHFEKEKSVKVACLGGIMESDTILARKITEKLGESKHLVKFQPKGSAIAGALAMARKLSEDEQDDF